MGYHTCIFPGLFVPSLSVMEVWCFLSDFKRSYPISRCIISELLYCHFVNRCWTVQVWGTLDVMLKGTLLALSLSRLFMHWYSHINITKLNKISKHNKKKKSRTQVYRLLHQCKGSVFQCPRDRTLLEAVPDLIFLSETGINNWIPPRDLAVPYYLPLIIKHNHLNLHSQGLSTYIKNRFPCGRDAKNNNHDLPYMCFCIESIHCTIFILTFYHPQNGQSLIFDQIYERIHNILTKFLSTSFHICG